ncbi:MAG: TIGR04149 family rSAM-modified RiPP [Bacteroidota bacterium]
MKSLKLNRINRNKLNNQQLNMVRGGESQCCGCGCAWEANGGSSQAANGNENSINGLNSPGGWKEIFCTFD